MGICYLYGAGTYYSDNTEVPADKDYVIAVDGGYNFLKKHNIVPDLIIGDFDSIEKGNDGNILSAADIPIISFPPEKDYTDMYLAAEEGIRAGYTDFAIYGGCGGRIDHTMSNISLLAHLASMNCSAFLIADGYIITAVQDSSFSLSAEGILNPALNLKAKKNGYISVLSHSDISEGVTISGLKYEADDITLTNTMVLGTSNEFCGRDAFISVSRGTLLILCEGGAVL